MFKTVKGESWRWSYRLFSVRAQKLKRKVPEILYSSTVVFSPTSIFNHMIKQESKRNDKNGPFIHHTTMNYILHDNKGVIVLELTKMYTLLRITRQTTV